MLMHRRTPALLALAAAPLLFSLTGCTTAPTLQVTSATVTDSSDEAVVVTFVINARNTTEDPLGLQDARYTVSLAGVTARVERSPEATLRALGEQEFHLPASFAIPRSQRAGLTSAPYSISGSVAYEPPDAVNKQFFQWGIYRPTGSISGSGTVDLAAAPRPVPAPAGRPLAVQPVKD